MIILKCVRSQVAAKHKQCCDPAKQIKAVEACRFGHSTSYLGFSFRERYQECCWLLPYTRRPGQACRRRRGFDYPFPPVGGVVVRRAAIGAVRILSRSISGIGGGERRRAPHSPARCSRGSCGAASRASSACRRWHAASNADSRPSSAEDTWSQASCNSAARCIAVYPPPPNDSSSPAANLGRGEIAVGGRDDQRGAWDDAQDLGHALARPHERDAARREMGVAGEAIARRGEFGVALGRGQRAAHGLHRDDQVDQILDGLLVLLQAHRMRSARAPDPG